MTDDQLLAMEAYAPTMEAQRRLDAAINGQIDLSPAGWFSVVLAVTGDRQQAEDAHNAAVSRSLKAGQPVGDTV